MESNPIGIINYLKFKKIKEDEKIIINEGYYCKKSLSNYTKWMNNKLKNQSELPNNNINLSSINTINENNKEGTFHLVLRKRVVKNEQSFTPKSCKSPLITNINIPTSNHSSIQNTIENFTFDPKVDSPFQITKEEFLWEELKYFKSKIKINNLQNINLQVSQLQMILNLCNEHQFICSGGRIELVDITKRGVIMKFYFNCFTCKTSFLILNYNSDKLYTIKDSLSLKTSLKSKPLFLEKEVVLFIQSLFTSTTTNEYNIISTTYLPKEKRKILSKVVSKKMEELTNNSIEYIHEFLFSELPKKYCISIDTTFNKKTEAEFSFTDAIVIIDEKPYVFFKKTLEKKVEQITANSLENKATLLFVDHLKQKLSEIIGNKSSEDIYVYDFFYEINADQQKTNTKILKTFLSFVESQQKIRTKNFNSETTRINLTNDFGHYWKSIEKNLTKMVGDGKEMKKVKGKFKNALFETKKSNFNLEKKIKLGKEKIKTIVSHYITSKGICDLRECNICFF